MGKFTFWGHTIHIHSTWVSVMQNHLRHSDRFKCTSPVANRLNGTAGEQLACIRRCSDFDEPCLYHLLIHPHLWLSFVQSDCLNCLGRLWMCINAPIECVNRVKPFHYYCCVGQVLGFLSRRCDQIVRIATGGHWTRAITGSVFNLDTNYLWRNT